MLTQRTTAVIVLAWMVCLPFTQTNAASVSQPTIIPADFRLVTIDSGDEIQLNKKRQGLVVAHVWASWCSYCRREHKLWQELPKQADVLYIAISFREAPEISLSYLAREPAPFNRYAYLDADNAKKIGVRTIPDTLIICRDQVLYRHIGSMKSKAFQQLLVNNVQRAVKQCEELT